MQEEAFQCFTLGSFVEPPEQLQKSKVLPQTPQHFSMAALQHMPL